MAYILKKAKKTFQSNVLQKKKKQQTYCSKFIFNFTVSFTAFL